MILSDRLLIAIVRAINDEFEQERLAWRWVWALRRGHEIAEQIREQTRHAPCTCATPAELADDGRCERCYGWPGVSS